MLSDVLNVKTCGLDHIATQYRKVKKIALQDLVLEPTFLKIAGDLAGKSVLDLGCGEGHYSRIAKRLGAAEVLGVDISPKMIDLAREEERANPLGIDYHVSDAVDLSLGRQFDLVFGVFLLNYAGSREELTGMCRTIARALKPGGRFVGLNTNMRLAQSHYDDCRVYGRWQTARPNRGEGDPITVNLVDRDGDNVSFDIRYLTPATYEAAFADAGLTDFSWEPITVSQAGYDAYPDGHWHKLLSAPPMTGVQARR